MTPPTDQPNPQRMQETHDAALATLTGRVPYIQYLGIQFERRLPLERLFGDLPDIGPVLDKMAEDQRIRKNRQEGLLPTEGDTIAIDAQSNETVIIKE